MFQLQIYQLKITQTYCSNYKQILKEQLTGTNIN